MCDKHSLIPAPTDKLYGVRKNGRIRIGDEYNGKSFVMEKYTDGTIAIIPFETRSAGRPRRVSYGTVSIGAQYAGQWFSRHPSDDGTITLLNRSKKAVKPDG